MTIQQTSDYDSFKYFVSNREIDSRHVKRLAASIARKNLMYIRPALVNEEMYVIDGQHRIEACRKINQPVYYLVVAGLSKTDIAILNTAQMNWRMLDFINFYAIEGVPEFIEFSRLINTYPDMKVSALIRLCENGRRSKIREGLLDIGNLGNTRRLCDRIKVLAQRGFEFVYERNFALAFRRLVNDKNFDAMVTAVTPDNFFKCFSENEYKAMLSQLIKS